MALADVDGPAAEAYDMEGSALDPDREQARMSMVKRSWLPPVAAMVLVLSTGSVLAQPQELTAGDVRKAIERGVSFLRQRQDRARGTWDERMPQYPGGVTALCTLALLNAGVPHDDPAIERALAYLESLGQPTSRSRTYGVSLRTMIFCIARPKRDRLLIQQNASWLERIQLKKGELNGCWPYGEGFVGGDKSNSQFALLALYEAERVGIKVAESTWRRAENYWQRQQYQDGSWAYRNDVNESSGSMTCAGIASLAITTGRLSQGDARVVDGQVHCCGQQEEQTAMQRGLDWLGRNFTVRFNPSNSQQQRSNWHFYYLYGVERVGRMTGRRFIGQHDWYREGTAFLLSTQNRLTGAWRGRSKTFVESEPNIATAFALLFLSKGRRPILVAKLKRSPGDDWNHHRSGLANVTRYVELRWNQDMTWQVVDIQAATVRDLLHTPVLFISGRDSLPLSAQQKHTLRAYVDNGGFLLLDACCGGQGFDRQARQLLTEMFPDSPLRLLPPDHPVWYAEQKVDPEFAKPLWGIDACCRTSVVYCPQDLSCDWELARIARGRQYPEQVQRQIDASLATGANILTYATNRQLREKLDIPRVLTDQVDDQPLARATLRIAELRYGGRRDDAPAALTNLLRVTEYQVQLPVGLQRSVLSPDNPKLPDFPIAFIHGRRGLSWTPRQRQALARYLTSGGVLFGDAICASETFADAFRREIQRALPDRPWQVIPPTHPMFTPEFGGYDVTGVTVSDPVRRATADAPLRARRQRTVPRWEGIEVDGRFVVIFSPLDISCALESRASLSCKGYVREDAARLGVNIILYALQ